MNHETISEKQLSAIPGIGAKSAWKLISGRAKQKRKDATSSFQNAKSWFTATGISWQDDFEIFFAE